MLAGFAVPVGQRLQFPGGATAIIATAAASQGTGDLLKGLSPRGKLVVVGVGVEGPLEVTATDLAFGLRSIEGSLAGSTADCKQTFAFTALRGLTPIIETMAL